MMEKLNNNSVKVLESRFLRKNNKGEFLETPNELFHRIAKSVAEAELHWGNFSTADNWEIEFYDVLSNLLFLPNFQSIEQGGKRRGANMGILNIDHPDIELFIEAKSDERNYRNFNISVGIYNDFMEAVQSNDFWILRHPVTGKATKKVRAQMLWDKIIACAWKTGDLGLIFLDEVNAKNPTPSIGKIQSTNPCGEAPLLPYESCNLGSVNLSRCVIEKDGFFEVNWDLLERLINTGVRFLDNVIEINTYTVPEIEDIVKGNRKIGLGVMGWAEMLIQMNIPYDSVKAVKLAEKVMKFIKVKADNSSAQLAEERGVFKNWNKSIYYPDQPFRNATRTSIAPTGTISIIANTSPSIEPLFALAFKRENVLNEETLDEVNSLFIERLKAENLYSRSIIGQLYKEGKITEEMNLPEDIKRLFKTSLEIGYEYHIKHQIAFQKYTDNAVSKTVNMPENASPEDIEDAYRMAWKNKLITYNS